MESTSDVSPRPTGTEVVSINGPPVSVSMVDDQGSCGSGTSSEDEGVGGESEESEGSGPDSTDGEQPNGEENEWSDGSESSVASSEGVGDAEQILFPAVLPATSVKFMAETVGCPLTNPTAAALGHLTMNNLRRLMMIANQLRKHDQSQGLSADHLAMAEKLMGNQSFGYRSTYSLPDFKHVGKGVSVLQDSRQIDLLGTTLHARKDPNPLRKMSRMLLSHHQLPTTTMPVGEGSVTGQFTTDELHVLVPLTSEDQDSYDSTSSYFVSDEEVNSAPRLNDAKVTKVKKLRKRSEVLARRVGGLPVLVLSEPNLTLTKITSNLEKLIERVLVLNEDFIPPVENEANGSDNTDAEKSRQVSNGVVVGIEWVDYVKVFLISFYHHRSLKSSREKGNNAGHGGTSADVGSTKKVSPGIFENGDLDRSCPAESPTRSKRLDASFTDFKLIIEDVISNGAFPVLGIILNFFNDYMDGRFGEYDVKRLQRMLNVLEATLKCPARTDTVYLHKIFKTLMKLASIPAPYELHQKIAQVFILLIKKGGKEFSTGVNLWTIEFITETIESCLTSCLHSFDLNMILINLALSLAIALEGIGIHLILELEWHSMVLEFVQALHYLRSQQMDLRQGNSPPSTIEPMDTEEPHQEGTSASGEGQPPEGVTRTQAEASYDCVLLKPQLEETLMVFFRLLLKGYTSSLPSETLRRIQFVLEETFGERIVPYVNLTLPDSLPRSKKRKIMKNHSGTSVTKRIRRIPWKTKHVTVGKIKIPSRRDQKAGALP